MNELRRFTRSDRFVTAVWILGIIVFWDISAFTVAEIFADRMAASKLPYLHGIIETIATNAPLLLKACATTLSRALAGFIAGAAVGFILAVAMSLFKSVERIAYPYLLLSQMVPILGLAPVVISIVRKAVIGPITIPASDITRVIIAAWITFFPVATNILAGLKSVEKDKRDLMFTYAARTPTLYAKLMIPSAVPYLFSGLKIAAPLAVTASILVDSLGAAEGIGYNLTYSLYTGTYTIFWASVLCSAAMGIFGYWTMVALEKIAMPWKRGVKK